MPYIICADIGGTKINTGTVKNNRVIKNHKVKTGPNRSLESFLGTIKKSIEIYQPEKAKAIAISWAAPVNHNIIQANTHFPKNISKYNLKKTVEGWFKKPVFIEHDGFCFTLAESVLGAGKKYRYVMGLTLGTGIGGGLVINKKIYRGYKNLMEVGHMKITENGFKCSCGQIGHFESQASGPALTKHYQKITGLSRNPLAIESLAKKGDRAAVKAAQELARYLGIALANYVNILSPDIIVIGGGLSRFKKIIDWAKQEAAKYVVYPGLNRIKVVKSRFEDNALLLGAYLMTNKKYQR